MRAPLRDVSAWTAQGHQVAWQPGLIWHEQAADHLAADQMTFDDLDHVVDRDTAVPDLLWVHDDADAELALIETSGVVGADDLAHAARGQLLLEAIANRDPVLGFAASSRMVSCALVGANENMAIESRHNPAERSTSGVEAKVVHEVCARAVPDVYCPNAARQWVASRIKGLGRLSRSLAITILARAEPTCAAQAESRHAQACLVTSRRSESPGWLHPATIANQSSTTERNGLM